MNSIRTRLVRIILFLFIAAWVAVSLATYYEARHEIEEVFDATLSQSAAIIGELTLDHVENGRLAHASLPKAVYGHHYERNISFQIWEGDKLLLRSQSAPEARLSQVRGFSDAVINDYPWRVFMLPTDDGRYTVYAGERFVVRDELVADIAIDSLYLLPMALPLIAVLLWVSIGRGLSPLQRVAREVAERTPTALTAIDVGQVPAEIQPLTRSLNILLSRLSEAIERESRFTADAAHELRTPLASIKTQAQVALRATDDAGRRDALDKIVLGVNRATHLVEQLLTLARLQPEIYRKDFSAVDLDAIVTGCIGDAAGNAARKNIRIDYVNRCEASSACRVSGNAGALTILLRNLIDNALHYTQPDGAVEVVLAGQGGLVELTVTDNGPGIPPDARQRVFDRFHRRVQDGQGCGLGLSIVQAIAGLHQARLLLEDAPSGRGLRVVLRMPTSG